jgi:hypothetical protein
VDGQETRPGDNLIGPGSVRKPKKGSLMRIGASLFLIAVGAILRFAVTEHVNGVSLDTVGVILMVVGAVGLLITFVMMGTRRRTDVIHQSGAVGPQPGTYVDGTRNVDGTRYVDVAGPASSRTTYVQPNDYDTRL